MKKFFSIFAFAMLSLCLVLTGCSNPIVGPEITDVVYGNGSMVVTKGDYVYYANGFVSASEADNTEGKVDYAGLYRVKNEDGKLVNPKLIASKVVGFEHSGLFIYDNAIYFASPSTRKDETSALRKDLISFYRANLDGSGMKAIHTTESFTEKGKFGFTVIDGRAYIIVYDGTTLYKLDGNGKKTVLSEDVTGAVIPSAEDIENNFYEADAFHKYAYVTKERTKEQFSEAGAVGNCLYRVELKEGKEEVIYIASGITLELTDAKNNEIYYKRNTSKSVSDVYQYATTGIARATFTQNEREITSVSDTVLYPVTKANGSNLGVVYVGKDNKKLFLRTKDGELVDLEVADAKIMFTKDSFVYYAKDTAMYRIDCNSVERVEQKLTGNYVIDSTYADVDDNYFYFFGKYKYDEKYDKEKDDKFYMYRVSLRSIDDASSEEEIKFDFMHEELAKAEDEEADK